MPTPTCSEYVSRYAAANDAERSPRRGGAARPVRDGPRNRAQCSLSASWRVSQEQSQRQAQQLRWNAVVTVAGVLVIALLIYFLIANRRYRQQLVKSREPGRA